MSWARIEAAARSAAARLPRDPDCWTAPGRGLIVAPALPPAGGLRAWGCAQLYALVARAGDGDSRTSAAWPTGRRARWGRRDRPQPAHAAPPLVTQEPARTSSSRRYRTRLFIFAWRTPGATRAVFPWSGSVARAPLTRRRIDRDACSAQDGGAGRPRARPPRAPAGSLAIAQQATGSSSRSLRARRGSRIGVATLAAEHRHPASPAVALRGRAAGASHSTRGSSGCSTSSWPARAGRSAGDRSGVGFDGEGADAGRGQDLPAHGATVGAPPDCSRRTGRTGACRRSCRTGFVRRGMRRSSNCAGCLRHAGGMRIDYVMGLSGLYWVPGTSTARDGAAVRYPTTPCWRSSRSKRAGQRPRDRRGPRRRAGASERLLAERILPDVGLEPDRRAVTSPATVTARCTHDLPMVCGL
jgi:4-alpha-glucanotransferase